MNNACQICKKCNISVCKECVKKSVESSNYIICETRGICKRLKKRIESFINKRSYEVYLKNEVERMSQKNEEIRVKINKIKWMIKTDMELHNKMKDDIIYDTDCIKSMNFDMCLIHQKYENTDTEWEASMTKIIEDTNKVITDKRKEEIKNLIKLYNIVIGKSHGKIYGIDFPLEIRKLYDINEWKSVNDMKFGVLLLLMLLGKILNILRLGYSRKISTDLNENIFSLKYYLDILFYELGIKDDVKSIEFIGVLDVLIDIKDARKLLYNDNMKKAVIF